MGKNSIQYQFNSTVMATVTFALFLSSIGMLIYSVNTYYKNKSDNLIARSQLISRAVIPALLFDDKEAAQNFIDLLKEEADVENAVIFDSDSVLFSSLNPLSPAEEAVIKLLNDNDIVVSQGTMYYVNTIMTNQEKVGYLALQVRFEISEALRAHIIIYFFVFLATLMAAYTFSVRLQKKVVDPLVGLTHLMRKIAISNDFSLRYTDQSQGEIGSLIAAVNQLLQEVSEKKQELEILNNSLHDEVKERQDAVLALKESQNQYLELNVKLEQRVKERTRQLESANQELEAFSYSVSHDLRAPLRAMDGFSQALLEDYFEQLDDEGKDYLNRVRAAAQRMGTLIDEMLLLSRVSRTDMKHITTDLSVIAEELIDELKASDPDRSVQVHITPAMQVQCDPPLMRIALANLLGNAWKYSTYQNPAVIEFGQKETNDHVIYFIKDNGVGFDMKYAQKLFIAFQRLHTTAEFSGTGIGLATVKRVISRHSGMVWAESELEKGSIFYFTLPL